ncbi:GNAT family N-acetyltransferase [Brucepastera parasyntrophica]|uniref:GNAT family N-acetyltransferase n=1 Tax=Brucepastera parasyntrophica TaxID=2880008 RepID=UPI00210ECB71|nr:GNAT family N-acetyltransferase [Brucepastera parasyntrophica]ULQ58645.1 GNAT family N-acetyltransferase [Brucepastera parasyntrophica]
MKIKRADSNDYSEIMKVWESSVKATHHFLKTEDFEYYKRIIAAEFFPKVNLYILFAGKKIIGFMGVSGENLEMLFIEKDSIGKGYGKKLLQYAIENLNVKRVDVNEQNKQALGFYEKSGFKITGRSEKDSMNKDYPVLHLSL